ARPAKSPQERGIGRPGVRLREGQLVISPGKSASCVKQPVSGGIADARPRRSGMKHRFAVVQETAGGRREERRTAADRDPVEIGKAWKRRVGGDAENDPIGKHVVIADLKAGKETSGFGERIESLKQAE